MSIAKNKTMDKNNPIGLDGMEFIEYSGNKEGFLDSLFSKIGMTEVAQHKSQKIRLFRQNQIHFIINQEPQSFAMDFALAHGPCVCSTGFRVKDSQKALDEAVARGARPYLESSKKTLPYPAIFGVGDSLIYFVDQYKTPQDPYRELFENTTENQNPTGHGFLYVDHMTNNVPKGELDSMAQFYEKIFNFREIRFFDIKGEETGLLSRAMRSPCARITIPINEPTEDKSQIQEYINEYKGAGIQHIALATKNICTSVSATKGAGINTLNVPDKYYDSLMDRVPGITEDLSRLKELRILADGNEKGYLLQIFTENAIGPIFYEFIQRKNNNGFGEGNFQALFEAMEMDQKRRGVL